MKALIHFIFALVLFVLTGMSEVPAQTFSTLYNFSATNYDAALGYPVIPGAPPTGMTNGDGAGSSGTLILSGGTLYGTALQGGTYAEGTVFAINTNGTGFSTLYDFTNGSDGAFPFAGLILSGTNLYGTATGAGSSQDHGTVFAISTNGSDFSTIHIFTGAGDGGSPDAGLVLSGQSLYGAANGASGASGTVFAINTNGPTYSLLLDFQENQGGNPASALIASGTNLFGTAFGGGLYSCGTIYKVSTNGAPFTLLHTFTNGTSFFPHLTNSDGACPEGGLVLGGNTLYGTTETGGSSGNGVIYAMNADGSGFTNLYSFTGTNSDRFNNDGAKPEATLVLSGSILYGTTSQGGTMGYGTVFAINTNGAGFTTLHDFTGGSDGGIPFAGLLLSGNILYGVTSAGGTNGTGAIFDISLPPSTLPAPIINSLSLVGTNLVINASGQDSGMYETLASVNPLLPFSQWTPVATNVLTVGGSFSVTNAINPSLPQEYYILQVH